jgi:hypothetical protein
MCTVEAVLCARNGTNSHMGWGIKTAALNLIWKVVSPWGVQLAFSWGLKLIEVSANGTKYATFGIL